MTDDALKLACLARGSSGGICGNIAVAEYLFANQFPSHHGERFNVLVPLCEEHCPDGALPDRKAVSPPSPRKKR